MGHVLPAVTQPGGLVDLPRQRRDHLGLLFPEVSVGPLPEGLYREDALEDQQQ